MSDAQAGDATSGSQPLADLAERYWRGCLAAEPVMATALGHRQHDAELADRTPDGRRGRRIELAELRAEVQALDPAGLTPEDRITHQELLATIGRQLDHLDAAPDRYRVSPLSGPQASLMRMPNLQPLRTRAEADAYRARLDAMGGHVDTCVANLREGLAAGLTSSLKPVERVARQLVRTLARPSETWSLAAHAREFAVADGEAAVASIDRGLRPAFARMLAFLLGELLPQARPDSRPGLCHLPDGAADYGRAIRYFTSLDADPQEVHDQGLAEVARLHRLLLDLGRDSLEVKTLKQLREALEGRPELHFSDSEEILEKARGAVARATERMPDICGLRPEAPCRVQPIPALEAPDAPPAYYQSPAADGSRPGTYYVNTHAPETKMSIDAEGVAFHEAVPGHHLQIAIAQELDLPDFRRHGGVAAYYEGWALYSEKLADELGLYSSDLDRLGMYGQDLWRAARLVLDTGLHALGWSRQEAIDFALRETLMPIEMIENEVDRFVVMPAQALSYKLGEMEILKLRRQQEAALGDDFRLEDFHDAVLEHGAVGLDTLGQLFE